MKSIKGKKLKQRALEFAAHYHRHDIRKYTFEPYITHLVAVGDMVEAFYKQGNERPQEYGRYVAAAILHDVVEDTPCTIEEIEEEFGERIARIVWFLTKPPLIAGGRMHRKRLYGQQLSLAPVETKVIKIYDMLHNAPSIKEHDPKFWECWREETRMMMHFLDAFELPCITAVHELRKILDD